MKKLSKVPPLISFEYLKYILIVFALLSACVMSYFYYHYNDDVFSKSLTFFQHLQLAIYSVGSMLYELFVPLLFFSGALLYRSVRLKGIHPLYALKRDLFVLLPLGILFWVYGAFLEEPVKRKFYSTIFDVQLLEPNERLPQDSNSYDAMKGDNLNTFHQKIDTLDIQIQEYQQILLKRNQPALENYIQALRQQQESYRNAIRNIHTQPFYVILFFLFGMLLGYLIPLHRAALIALLLAISYCWYFTMNVAESLFNFQNWNTHSYLLGKIGLLIVLNSILLVFAIKRFKQSVVAN